MARVARPGEREALHALWERTFPEDAGEFASWFFEDRYLPDWCLVAEREGRLAGVAHTFPLHMRVRDTVLPCAILCGVATEKAFRGQGVMHEVMAALMRLMRERGVPLVPHRPREIHTYYSIAHYPMNDAQYVTLPAEAPRPFTDTCLQTNMRDACSALYSCYRAFAGEYSGAIERSYADFAFKCSDYAASRADCIHAETLGRVEGYCIYYEEGGELYGDECVALSPEAYRRLYEGMALRAAGRKLRIRVAPDVYIPGTKSVTEPKGVLGVSDVRPLLRAVGLSGGAVEITDAVVKENQGVMDLEGNPTNRPPQLRISAGRLAQWALGYRSMADIVQAGEAEDIIPAAVPLLDSAGTRPCFMVDEY